MSIFLQTRAPHPQPAKTMSEFDWRALGLETLQAVMEECGIAWIYRCKQYTINMKGGFRLSCSDDVDETLASESFDQICHDLGQGASQFLTVVSVDFDGDMMFRGASLLLTLLITARYFRRFPTLCNTARDATSLPSDPPQQTDS